MSYDTHESLEKIVYTLRDNLPELKAALQSNESVHLSTKCLQAMVEMIDSLITRYDKKEIEEKKK